jgi:hypothetical protein
MPKTLSRHCGWYRNGFLTIISHISDIRQRLDAGTSFAASFHYDAAHQSICWRGAAAVLPPETFENACEDDIT